ncbi:unnamed protein product [Cylicostephanus goldi]|uniref:Uncharacterized protein n=1 Tax=Cylicostephanus goldi TaxID=71465 RepID=A0A3P7M0M1_CYLGO|nr:unnamed protein product [Cylicostephanus goldi]
MDHQLHWTFQNHVVCVLCDNEQQLSDVALLPSKKVATVILFSCLARYGVIPLDVKTRYKNLFVARKRICKEHFIQASTLPIDKKDVREFINEYMAEFRDEVAAKLNSTDTPECTLFLKHVLYRLKANANLDLKKEQEEPSTSQDSCTEQLPSTSGMFS